MKLRIFFGLNFIAGGLLLLLINMGEINLSDLENFFTYWPVLLILIGLAMLLRNIFLYFFISASLLGAVFFFAIADPYGWHDNEVEPKNETVQPNIVAVYTKPIDNFKLTLDLGAAVINVKDLNDQNADTLLRSNYGGITNLEETRANKDNVADLHIKEAGVNRNTLSNSNKKRFMNLELSDRLPIEFNINSGASKLDLDFSNIDLKKLNVNSGASIVKVKFGQKAESLNAEINSGASSIELTVPKDFGVKIDSNSLLLGKNFSDLDFEQNQNSYTSRGYESKTKKLNIKLSSGVSKLTVTQY